MKIMTYNILLGGEKRLDQIIEVIRAEEPDILAIQEANHFDQNNYELLKKLSDGTRMPYTAFAPGTLRGSGNQFHVATLSRTPIRSHERLRGFHHACLQTLIETDLGKLFLCNAHLNPHDEPARVIEAKRIIRAQNSYARAIILGDLNALSPNDMYNDLLPKFTDFLKKSFTNKGVITTNTLSTLYHAGYLDTALLTNTTQRTMPTPTSKYYNDGLTFRIDYILIKPTLAPHVREARVVNTHASDHYPYWVRLE